MNLERLWQRWRWRREVGVKGGWRRWWAAFKRPLWLVLLLTLAEDGHEVFDVLGGQAKSVDMHLTYGANLWFASERAKGHRKVPLTHARREGDTKGQE